MPLTSRLINCTIDNTTLDINEGGLYVDNSDDTYHPILLQNEATVWEDLRVPTTATRRGGSRFPTLEKFLDDGLGSQGLYLERFSASSEEELYFSCQLPHSYKEGTDLEAHIHWGPETTATGNVIWGLEYAWANIGDPFPANSTIITATVPATTVAKDHAVAELGNIDGTGKTISSMLNCRIFRQAAAGGDTYGGEAWLYEIDFHYQIDSLGSRQEYVK